MIIMHRLYFQGQTLLTGHTSSIILDTSQIKRELSIVIIKEGGPVMKLAEALVLRADLQKRIAQLRERLRQSALVQEGELPPENPEQLLTELDQLLNQLGAMIARINRTNMQVHLPEGEVLSDALARRDMLSLRYGIITALAETAANRIERYGRSEIRKISTVDVAALRRQLDEIARQRRELDTTIQATNWTVDVVE